MLFSETLKKLSEELNPLISEAFEIAYKKQVHHGDLLLLVAHAHKDSDPRITDLSTGKGFIGLSMQSQMQFISDYRRALFLNKASYYDALEKMPSTTPPENFTIHIEVLIYLKVWEMSMFQKQLYQLSLLMNGENYEWNGIPSRTSNNLSEAFAKIKVSCPKLYNWLDGVYNSKIRNAIAHSDFFIIPNEGIQFLKDNRPYKYVLLDDWNNIFSKTLLLQNGVAEQINKYSQIYKKEASIGEKYIIVKAPNVGMRDVPLSFDPPNGWIDYRNLIASGITPS